MNDKINRKENRNIDVVSYFLHLQYKENGHNIQVGEQVLNIKNQENPEIIYDYHDDNDRVRCKIEKSHR